MVEPKLVFGGFKAVFDRPAMTFDGDESLDARAGRTPCREEGEITIADIAPDQKAAGPKPRLGIIIFVGIEIGEFAIGPVMEPGAFGALASRKTLPNARFELSRDFLGRTGDEGFAPQEPK